MAKSGSTSITGITGIARIAGNTESTRIPGVTGVTGSKISSHDRFRPCLRNSSDDCLFLMFNKYIDDHS